MTGTLDLRQCAAAIRERYFDMHHTLDRIHTLEAETGRPWYRRPEEK